LIGKEKTDRRTYKNLKRIFGFIAGKKQFTGGQLVKKGMSASIVYELLDKLKEKQLIKKVGEKKSPGRGKTDIFSLTLAGEIVAAYINENIQLLFHALNKLIEKETEYDIFGQIIVIPTILDEQLIETYDRSKFSWLDPNLIDPQPSGFVYAPHNSYIPSLPKPSANGVICKKEYRGIYLEVHRNGCVEYAGDFSRRDNRYGRILFLDKIFCLRLLHTLQFANSVFLRYNYFGNVKIVTSLRGCGVRDAWLSTEPDTQPPEWRSSCSSNSIIVKREYASNTLETDFSFIAANIMNEIFNHFGKWKCPFFDDQGNYLENLLRRDP